MEQKVSCKIAVVEEAPGNPPTENERLVLAAHRLIVYRAKAEELKEQIRGMQMSQKFYERRIKETEEEIGDLQNGQTVMDI